ncbi:hypothetical protein QTP70_024480 [Hemibagrus guttatus]|uniref:Uncharacterized protein n=1 Tax=Hemibagrus guttatus TaxID=175788 RepID=A0AAE0R9R9_9TELE|nr:hypothetical protein QTP70_024480 [Hemibagrus guttatus]
MDNLERPINLNWGGNQSTQRKPPRHRENMQTPNTHGGGGNRTHNPGGSDPVLHEISHDCFQILADMSLIPVPDK